MADVNELIKLNRDQLNQFATQNGVEDAADENKYVTKKDLAEVVAPNVSPEQLDAFKNGDTQSEEQTNDEPDQVEDRSDEPAQSNEPVPTPPIDTSDDVKSLEDSGTEDAPGVDEDDDDDDEEDDEPTPRVSRPRQRYTSGNDPVEDGMGFPMKNGKTLSIFSNKPHETVRNVAGHMVPLTTAEAVGDNRNDILPKTDQEIIEKLKKLGKI